MIVASFTGRFRAELAALLDEGVRLEIVDPTDQRALREFLPKARVLITTRFDARLAPLCSSLEVILSPAAGTELIDRAALPPGVAVVNGVGHEVAIAEYAIGALVALRQRFLTADAGLRKNRWLFGFFGSGAFVDELFGSTLGLIGFGRIGQEIAKRANAFGVQCGAVTLHPAKPVEPGLLGAGLGDIGNAADVDTLIGISDAVVIACELSGLTHGMIDARRLQSMRPNAVLVNVSRGQIVDEAALFEALRLRRIAGAAVDVWYAYPPEGGSEAPPSAFPFAELDNVLMTPHSSGWTVEAQRRKIAFLADRINELHRRSRA